MDLTKLGRTERVLAIVGLLAFINTFVPWWDVSAKGSLGALGVVAGGSASGSGNAWDIGFWAWFPMLLLLALGVLAALPAFGQSVKVRGGYAAIGAAAALSTIIIIFLLLLYSPIPSELSAYIDDSPTFGSFVALILGIVATVFSYLAFTAAGGSLNKFADAFKAQPQEAGYAPPAGGYVPPASGYAQPGDQPPTWGQQPPQQ